MHNSDYETCFSLVLNFPPLNLSTCVGGKIHTPKILTILKEFLAIATYTKHLKKTFWEEIFWKNKMDLSN